MSTLYNHFSAYYGIDSHGIGKLCGLMACGEVANIIISLIFILRRCNMKKNFIAQIKSLISKADRKVLSRAARLLVYSDAHDDYFINEVKQLVACSDIRNGIPMGKFYVLPKSVIPTKQLNTDELIQQAAQFYKEV